MKPHDDDFNGAAFYVSKRTPAEWLRDPPAVLAARFTFLAEAPRLVFTWGTWRRRRHPPGGAKTTIPGDGRRLSPERDHVHRVRRGDSGGKTPPAAQTRASAQPAQREQPPMARRQRRSPRDRMTDLDPVAAAGQIGDDGAEATAEPFTVGSVSTVL